MEIEKWKPIKGFEDYYEISSFGRVYSFWSKKILKPNQNKNGYQYICLKGNNNYFFGTIHRLVAKHFIQKSNGKDFINHIDENKQNNKASNLEWCTKQYNNTYNGKAQRCCKPVIQLDKRGNFIQEWPSARIAAKELQIQYKNISAVCREKRNYCGGYIWRFKNV